MSSSCKFLQYGSFSILFSLTYLNVPVVYFRIPLVIVRKSVIFSPVIDFYSLLFRSFIPKICFCFCIVFLNVSIHIDVLKSAAYLSYTYTYVGI
jgi:hypothetical protein